MNINKALTVHIGFKQRTAMTDIATAPVYQLADFEAIKWYGFECELPESVIALVSRIADQVGAPSYVKTPVFPKRDKGGDESSSASSSQLQRKPRTTASEITADDWEIIRRFQATELKKREGIDAHLDSIRSDLNKITDKTLDEVFDALCKRIDELKDEPEIQTVGAAIFNTASSNHFFSAVYARLFHQLLEKYDDVFKGVFQTNFDQFITLFGSIEHADAKKDYTRFCEVNKTNDKRRAMSLFIVNLMKVGVVSTLQTLDIVQQLQTLIQEHLRQSDRTNEVEELTENLFIILKDAHVYLSRSHKEEWEAVVLEIEFNSKLKPKNAKYPSITNKTIFKHMDMLDEVNKKL